MMNSSLLKLAALNASRKPARTVLTAGMVVAAVALLIISMSWLDGIWDTMLGGSTDMIGHVEVATPAWADRSNMNPLYENIADVEPVLEAVRSDPNVVAAYPIIETGVTVSVGEEIGEHFGGVVGAPLEYMQSRLRTEGKMVEGRWYEGPDELVLGHKLVRDTGAKLGDEVVILGVTQDGSMSPLKGKLVGILRAGTPAIDAKVYLPLERAQYLTDIPGGAIRVLAFGEDYKEADTVAASLAERLPDYAVRSWTVRPPWNQTYAMMGAIRGMLFFIVVFLAALGVWNTMMMSVLERTNEIGVLRAMGLTRLGAVGLFVGEAVAIAVLGGVVGIVAGVVPYLVMKDRGITFTEKIAQDMGDMLPTVETMYPQLEPSLLVTAFLMGVLMAFIGSLLPAIHAAMIQPVVAMRRN